MAGLDFDKMDDLELFVRHLRHKIANVQAAVGNHPAHQITAEGISATLCECIDFAWAEVSVRREREHTAWVNGRGLDFVTREPARQPKGGGK